MVHMKMYIVNHSTQSREKVDRVFKILEDHLRGDFKLEVLNIMEHLEDAQQDNVLATPTVIKISPDPPKRIVGDLSDKCKILAGLGLAQNGCTAA